MVKGSNSVQARFFLGFLFATTKVAYITAMIFIHITLHSAVHIHDFHISVIASKNQNVMIVQYPCNTEVHSSK